MGNEVNPAVDHVCALVRKSDYEGLRNYLESLQSTDLLRECAELFRFYEASHLAKGTEESTAKAVVNATIATKIETRLAA